MLPSFPKPADPRRRLAALAVLLAPLLAAGPLRAGQDTRTPAGQAPPSSRKARPVDVRFADGSTLKLVLLDEHIELLTRYGKLLIPVEDIQQIEFGLRIPDDVARRIEAAIADLGHPDFRRRQAASDTLLALQERAYPALLEAAKGRAPEVVRRAEEIVKKLRDDLPAERLEVRGHDVVHTKDSKIAGRVTASTLRVKTFQFGEQQLRVADVRSLGTPAARAAEPANVLPDPGTLHALQGQVGQALAFRVTGAAAGAGGIWGTDIYTTDSTLAVAAVHAGVLQPGQTGVVRVTVLGPVAGFQSSTRNGVTSGQYAAYTGYRIEKRQGR